MLIISVTSPCIDDVVPLGRDARLREQVLDVGEVDRAAVDVVVGVVVVLGLFDAPADGNFVDVPDVLGAGGVDDLRALELAVGVVEDDLDAGFAFAAEVVLVLGVPWVVDQIRRFLGPDTRRAGQAQREQDGVDDVGLPDPFGPVTTVKSS